MAVEWELELLLFFSSTYNKHLKGVHMETSFKLKAFNCINASNKFRAATGFLDGI